jgi:3-isopropylmalate/(R)-2-methylmalate dehydratase small subunit
LLESDDAPDGIKAGDTIEVDLEKGIIKNITTGKQFQSKPYPEFMSVLVKAGGLIEYTKRRVGSRK